MNKLFHTSMDALIDPLFCRNALNAPAAYFINWCDPDHHVIVLNNTGDIYDAIIPVNRPVKQAFIRPRNYSESSSCECLVAVNIPYIHAVKPVKICIGGHVFPDSFLHADPASGWLYFDFPIFISCIHGVVIIHDGSPTVMIRAVMLPVDWSFEAMSNTFVSSDNTFTFDYFEGIKLKDNECIKIKFN